MLNTILQFWFEDIAPAQWWRSDPAFDALLKTRFFDVHQQAACGECHAWRDTPRGRLAEIIVLDQFSRNLFRGTPTAFVQDPTALVLAQEAVRQGALAALNEVECGFMLMPMMHSESALIHQQAEPLFRAHAPYNHPAELQHKAIIDRFGRYPHRNAILGRPSTPEELSFLQQPGSSF